MCKSAAMGCTTMPCALRWRPLQICCAVASKTQVDTSDSALALRLAMALRRMDAKDAYAVLRALGL